MFLLLRPEHKCQASQQAMELAGLKVKPLALQKIEADNTELQQLPLKLQALAENDSVIFVSPVAAELAAKSLTPEQWPVHLNYFAVGSATARVLEQQNLQVTTPADQRTEGLLALEALQQLGQQGVLLVKGKNGRQTLHQELSQRGASVESAELYQRRQIDVIAPEIPWQQQDIQCVICTSNEQIKLAFAQLPKDWLQQLCWIVVSPRAEQKLKEFGVTRIHQSQGASDQALIDAAQIVSEQHMSETPSTEHNKQQGQTPSAPTAPDKTTPTKAPTGGKFALFLGLANLLALLAITAAGYWFWQQWQLQQAEQVSQQQIQNLQSKLNQQQQSTDRALKTQQQTVEQQVQQLLQANELQQQKLQQLAGRRPNDWLLAEAEFLVKMAGRKIWLEKDLQTSIALLTAADQRLQNLADPSLLPVRQLLHQDIQQLKQVNPVDTQKIALQLLAMVEQGQTLPLAMLNLPEATEASQQQQLTQSTGDWQQNLKTSWQQFVQGFISVKRRTEAIKPLMSRQQQWYSRQQLQHYLLLAQQALMNNQQALYQQSLQQALAHLNRDFDLSEVAVSNLAQQLQSLSQQDIERVYPNQLQALQPIKDLLQSRAENVFNTQGSAL